MQLSPDDLKDLTPEKIAELQKQQCVFCKIVKGELPSKKVYEDSECLAILDINPANPGHLLVLPREHYAIMPQLPEELTAHLAMVSKALSEATLKALKSQGTTVFIANGVAAGQKAPHFMLHIIPRFQGDNLSMQLPENRISKENIVRVADALRQGLQPEAEQGTVTKKNEKEKNEKEEIDLNKISGLFEK